MSDEIYAELSFDDTFKSISNYCPEQTIISSGLSKWCAAGGWRLGHFVIPHELTKLKNSLKVLASETFSSVSAPIQYAVLAGFENFGFGVMTWAVSGLRTAQQNSIQNRAGIIPPWLEGHVWGGTSWGLRHTVWGGESPPLRVPPVRVPPLKGSPPWGFPPLRVPPLKGSPPLRVPPLKGSPPQGAFP